jgi:hypothetical protein
MQPMQPAGAAAVRDRVVVEAEIVQLPTRHHAVLATSDRRDRRIDVG